MADYKAKTNWLPDDPINEDDLNRWEQGIKDANEEGDEHRNNKENPHEVTKKQIGLGNVSNDRQAKKEDFENHKDDKKNPHGVTTEQVNISTIFEASEPGSSYSNGISMFQTANGVSLGFPVNQIIVHTIRQGSHRCFQYIYDASTNVDTVWYRTWRLDSGWRDLVENETLTGAQQKVDKHESRKDNPHNVTSKQLNNITFKPATDSASTYPEGISLHFISSHSNNTEGYPYGFGTVQTNRVHDSRTFQIFTGNGDRDDSKNSWTRWAFENTWTSWEKMETAAGAQAKADKAESNAKAASVSKNGDTMSGALTLNRGLVLGTAYIDSVGALYRRTSEDDLRAKMARGWVSLETTDGAATKVKAHADLRNNPHNVTSEQINVIGFKLASELASTYPSGVTLFSISNQNNDVTGYPFGYGTIQTNRIHNSRTFQIFTGNGDTLNSKNSWIRWAFENSWTDWQEYMNFDTGWVRLTLQNGVKLYTDNPTGLFIRRVGQMVQLRGAVTNILAENTQITTIPMQFRPVSGRSIMGNISMGEGTVYYARYYLTGHSGALTMTRTSRGASAHADGIWYPLDFTWMIDG